MIYDVIRFEPANPNWFIFKHPADEFNNKSKLIVSPGQVALLVHNGKVEKIVENGTIKLNTEYYPIIKGLIKAFHKGGNAYPLEVYFINKVLKLDFFWGTSSPIDLIDPKYKIAIKLRARGQFGIKLVNYQFFFENFIGTVMKGKLFTFELLNDKLRALLNQRFRESAVSYILANKVSYFEIAAHLDEISEAFTNELKPVIESYGLNITKVLIESINVPEADLKKLQEILYKKAEYEQLGDETYRLTRGYDVLEGAAKNQGTAGTIMGVGLGQNVAGGMGSIIPERDPSKKLCVNCNYELLKNAKFCPNCGAKVEKSCLCGAKLAPKVKFCPECGRKQGE